jgi:hypothetical protein
MENSPLIATSPSSTSLRNVPAEEEITFRYYYDIATTTAGRVEKDEDEDDEDDDEGDAEGDNYGIMDNGGGGTRSEEGDAVVDVGYTDEEDESLTTSTSAVGIAVPISITKMEDNIISEKESEKIRTKNQGKGKGKGKGKGIGAAKRNTTPRKKKNKKKSGSSKYVEPTRDPQEVPQLEDSIWNQRFQQLVRLADSEDKFRQLAYLAHDTQFPFSN